MRRVATLGALILALAAGGASAAPSQSAEVTMPGKLFAPEALEVLVGTTVTWRNADRTTHTVTEDEDVFDSGFVRPGATFTRLFSAQGTFAYHCTIHRFMRGTVRVYEVVLRGPDEPLLAGRKARLDGIAPAGTTEVVLEHVSPGPVAVVGRVVPGDEGAFSFRVGTGAPRSYRARAGSASSPVVRVAVSPRVAVARTGAGVAVAALPARPGSRVLLQEYVPERFDFVTVARARLDDSSRATIAYSPDTTTHVRAVVRGSGGWSDGASRALVVRPG